jgi:hypothetical protein
MGVVRSKLVYLVMASVRRTIKREFSDFFRKRDMDSDSTFHSHHLSEVEHVVGLGLVFRVGERERRTWGG